jgi:DNA primase
LVADRAALKSQVREASDIVAVVSAYISVQPAGPVYKAVCPFHNDTRPSLQIDPKWQNYRCWACGAKGDVFTFVMEYEKVRFPEAIDILARRAGINLEEFDPTDSINRRKMLDAMAWAEKRYQHCLLETEIAQRARKYIGERRLSGPSVRGFGLGFAPATGDWLLKQAVEQKQDVAILQDVGMLGARNDGTGFYDRFRDRVMFPIRDSRGQTVGFGGRILPDSPFKDKGPKYYNSSDTPLFFKKELLYGLDVARHSGGQSGFLAVVEGYTDVMMAHQHGVTNVVATMGTALNETHVRQLRRFVPKVVLVFDADEGGLTGVDRALEIFVSCDVELAIATLPDGLDPCDLLVAQGPEPFKKALANAKEALDFKLDLLLERSGTGIESTKRIIDEILGTMAHAPEILGQAGQVKMELLITRISHRLGLRQETVWTRFGELRQTRKDQKKEPTRTPAVQATSVRDEEPEDAAPVVKRKPADGFEVQLVQILLAEPALIAQTYNAIGVENVEHPGLRQIVSSLYRMWEEKKPVDLDGLRDDIENPKLIRWAFDNQEIGRGNNDRGGTLRKLLLEFPKKRRELRRRQLKDQLPSASPEEAARIMKEIQELSVTVDPQDGRADGNPKVGGPTP